jgi:Meiotically Up-regulated Gene 113 (MUG113) protein
MTREFILNEIKRTAEANGGKALGRQRFIEETRIKEYEWKGKIWARWGDAVREAGYSPGELRTAFADAYLLEQLAILIRDLGHFAVKMEMRLRKRSDGGFPNEKVYERFGTKSQLASRVIDHCRSKPGFEDVIGICQQVSTNPRESVESGSAVPEEFGFVYLLKSGRYYKIGRSNAAGRRERELDIQLPEKATNMHMIRTDDPVGIEKYWHNRFAIKRVRPGAEWFRLDSTDLTAFRRRKFM